MHIYTHSVPWGELMPEEKPTFKYRCLTKIHSCSDSFCVMLKVSEPGSHHDQHVATAHANLAYMRSCDHT